MIQRKYLGNGDQGGKKKRGQVRTYDILVSADYGHKKNGSKKESQPGDDRKGHEGQKRKRREIGCATCADIS
jgi:hypothetical protein